MKLVIKGMTSRRSKEEVRALMTKLGLHPIKIVIGEVQLEETYLSSEKRQAVEEVLQKHDYGLVIHNEQIVVEKLKYLIIEMIYYSQEMPKVKYSEYLSVELGVSYCHLSRIFSKHNDTTIQWFIIKHKIERAKQLILYNELTISEIAWRLDYSSTAHLSSQFKRVTGYTPSVFRKFKTKNLDPPYNVDGNLK